MSIQAANTYRNTFQYGSFSEKRKSSSTFPEVSQKLEFFLSLFKEEQRLKRKSKNDNFPEEKWWKCLKPNCGAYNLRSVWRCAYCGTPR